MAEVRNSEVCSEPTTPFQLQETNTIKLAIIGLDDANMNSTGTIAPFRSISRRPQEDSDPESEDELLERIGGLNLSDPLTSTNQSVTLDRANSVSEAGKEDTSASKVCSDRSPCLGIAKLPYNAALPNVGCIDTQSYVTGTKRLYHSHDALHYDTVLSPGSTMDITKAMRPNMPSWQGFTINSSNPPLYPKQQQPVEAAWVPCPSEEPMPSHTSRTQLLNAEFHNASNFMAASNCPWQNLAPNTQAQYFSSQASPAPHDNPSPCSQSVCSSLYEYGSISSSSPYSEYNYQDPNSPGSSSSCSSTSVWQHPSSGSYFGGYGPTEVSMPSFHTVPSPSSLSASTPLSPNQSLYVSDSKTNSNVLEDSDGSFSDFYCHNPELHFKDETQSLCLTQESINVRSVAPAHVFSDATARTIPSTIIGSTYFHHNQQGQSIQSIVSSHQPTTAAHVTDSVAHGSLMNGSSIHDVKGITLQKPSIPSACSRMNNSSFGKLQTDQQQQHSQEFYSGSAGFDQYHITSTTTSTNTSTMPPNVGTQRNLISHTQPCGLQGGISMGQVSHHNKMPIPPLSSQMFSPQQPSSSAQLIIPTTIYPNAPVIVLVSTAPAVQKKCVNIAPKPANGITEAVKQPEVRKTNIRMVKEPKKSASAVKEKKQITAAPPGTGEMDLARSRLLNARARLALCTDEQLLTRLSNGETVLHKAILLKEHHVTLALFEKMHRNVGVRPLLNMPNTKNQTPLFLAVTLNQTWVVKKLVEFHADVNAMAQSMDVEGHTEHQAAIHYAASHGSRCLAELQVLVNAEGFEVDLKCSSGMTALHLALWNHGQIDPKTKAPINSVESAKVLLRAGARIEEPDNKSGKTALHFAVESKCLELVQLIGESQQLVEASRVDIRTYERRTALHLAAALRMDVQEKLAIIRYLISKGASISNKDNNRVSPKDMVPPQELEVIRLLGGIASPTQTYATVSEMNSDSVVDSSKNNV